MGSWVAPLVDGELVAQREDLELEGGARSEASAERREEGEEDSLHEARRLPHLGGTHRESLAAVAFCETLLMTVASPFSGRTTAWAGSLVPLASGRQVRRFISGHRQVWALRGSVVAV